MKTLSALVFALVLAGLSGCMSAMPGGSSALSNVDVDPWPRRLTSGEHTFSIFQPQYERWDQGRLTGRAAVVVENPVSPEPQYGVIRFTARTEVDKETRLVTLEDLTIAKADFPTAPEGGGVYLAALRQALSAQPLTIALDRLQAEPEVERAEDPGRIVQVKNDAPRIIVSEQPALLVRIDGQPVLRHVAGTDLLRVTNTRVLLLLDRSADRYYLWLMTRWLAAPKLDGPWAAVDTPPASLQTAKEVALQSNEVDLKGQPALSPITGTDILEVTNTDDDLFVYTPQQEYYARLSGRWFRAGSLQGPWEFVASGDLPRDFTVTRRYPHSSQ